jgi:NhaP-type Na+/H+ and K+/H+ antiporter
MFGRVFWMMVGPLSLVLTIYLIVTSGSESRLVANIAYFVILLGMALGKWAEFRGGNPLTAAGDPATPTDLRRYVLAVLIGGPIVWVIANVAAKHLPA